MDANQIAVQFINTILPLADDLKPEFRKKLAHYLLSDLGQISRQCVAGKFNKEELIIVILTFAAVKIFIAYESCGLFSSDIEAENYLENWHELEPQMMKQVLESLHKSLKPVFDQTITRNVYKNFKTPTAVRFMDARYGSDYYHSAATALYRYAQVLVSTHNEISQREEQALKNIWKMIFIVPEEEKIKLKATANKQNRVVEDIYYGKDNLVELEEDDNQDSLEKVLKELDDLIGLQNIKKEVLTLVNFLKVQKERSNRGLGEMKISLHSVFYGPPGTGKTTVARILSRIFKQMGFIEEGHLIETDRAGMVGSYVGHTAEKVDERVEEAMGGVLFIDEAYALKPAGSSGNDFGQEAIDILIKRMEDYRDNLVIIVAGYPDEMERFIKSNPGLKSRFNRYFYFDHYKPHDLLAIFNVFCSKSNYLLKKNAEKKLLKVFKVLYGKRNRYFGNGRLARNIFEKIIERQANRLVRSNKLSDDDIMYIEKEDIPDYFEDESNSNKKEDKKRGFFALLKGS